MPFTCCIIFLTMATHTHPCSLYPTLHLSTLCVERHTPPQPGCMQPLPCSISVSKTTSHTAASVTFKRTLGHFRCDGCRPRPIPSHLSQQVALCLLLAMRVVAHCCFFAFPSSVRLPEPWSLYWLWINLPIYFLCLHILVTFFSSDY